MNYFNYKLINDICASVFEAVNYISKNNNDRELLLEGCKLSVKSIEQKLEQEKASVKSNRIFEILKEIENEINTGADINAMLKSAEELINECRDGLEYKIRVLFCAELGAKWDSMASVYEAFKKRDDCIVDVVLEPIFRSVPQPDGTNKTKVIYDDWLTPLGIKHIPYEKYNMSKIRPDITFISQPYESCTVPMFWPQNIAKYSRLVYVPYYTIVSIDANTANDVIFQLPVQQYSWKIICQTEVLKEYYFNYGTQKGRNVMVTGLPKWDFPMSLTRKNVSMPNSWKKKLNGRTVFLWNTHFSTQGRGSQIFSPKGMNFLKIFIDDPSIALIWRPHPMMETIVSLYYTDAEKKLYENMKHIFEISKNMIIDKNESYDAAFVYSDALISDVSSLVEQYVLTKKPILMVVNKDLEYMKAMLSKRPRLYDIQNMRLANTIEMQKEFINNVVNKNDSCVENQQIHIDKFYSLADGHCGERVTDAIIDEYKHGIFKPYRKTDVLIIGNLKESEPCIKLFRDNKTDFYICDLMLNSNERFNNSCFSLDEIHNFDYDCIVITAKTGYDFLKDVLIKDYKIDNNKIIVFERVYNACIPNMMVDRVMTNPNNQNYDGMILGISHTEVGIMADRLNGNFCNLALSSQDLYYQLQTLLYCRDKYYNKIKGLKTAIIDLYDYYYFNFDTSRSGSAMKYYAEYGGYIKDGHNFEQNKMFDYTFKQVADYTEGKRFVGVTDSHIKLWNKYLLDVFNYTNFRGLQVNFELKNRLKIVNEQEIDGYNYGKRASKIFEPTINENIEVFRKMINTFREINPDIKIYTVMLPKYIETEKRHEPYLIDHVEKFEKIITDLQKELDFTHLDFKKISDISNNRLFYFDAAHLNTYGAYKLTEMLNNIIFG